MLPRGLAVLLALAFAGPACADTRAQLLAPDRYRVASAGQVLQVEASGKNAGRPFAMRVL